MFITTYPLKGSFSACHFIWEPHMVIVRIRPRQVNYRLMNILRCTYTNIVRDRNIRAKSIAHWHHIRRPNKQHATIPYFHSNAKGNTNERNNLLIKAIVLISLCIWLLLSQYSDIQRFCWAHLINMHQSYAILNFQNAKTLQIKLSLWWCCLQVSKMKNAKRIWWW